MISLSFHSLVGRGPCAKGPLADHVPQRKGDRYVCCQCGAWKWVVPHDERNSWRAATCVPNTDIRNDVLKLLPKGLELQTPQIANFLGRNRQGTHALLQAMEKDGVVVHRYLSVDKMHYKRQIILLWRATGKALPSSPTSVVKRGVVEADKVPAPHFTFDGLLSAMSVRTIVSSTC